jgi:hypothetical protein
MAQHVFSYPTVAGATNTLTFNDGATGIARLADDVDTYNLNSEIGQTLGGSDQVKEYGVAKNVYQFSFIVPKTKTASEIDLADVKVFLAIVRNLYTFQWTDVDNSSTVHTVRMTTNPVQWTRMGGKWFKITIELREQ